MNKKLKILLYAAGGFAALFAVALIAASIIIPKYYPPSRIKKMITEQLSLKLHRTIRVKDARFDVWSGFKITGLYMSNRAGWTAKPFLAADNIVVTYRLFPLLWFSLQLGEVRLDKPVVLVEKKGADDFNFSDMTSGPAPATTETKALGAPSGAASKALVLLQVGKVVLNDAQVTYIDWTKKPVMKVELPQCDLTVKNISLSGGKTTLVVKSPVVYGGTTYPVDIKASWKLFIARQSVKSLEAAGSIGALSLQLSGDASMIVDDFSPDLKGEVSLDLAKAGSLMPKSSGSLPKGLELSGPFAMPFSLGGSLRKGFAFDGSLDLTSADLAFGSAFHKTKGTVAKADFKTVVGDDFLKVPSLQAVLGAWAFKAAVDLTGLEKYPGDPKAHPAFAFSLSAPGLPLAELKSFSPTLKDYDLSGTLGANVRVSGSAKNPAAGSMSGSLDFKGLNAKGPDGASALESLTGKMAFTDSAVDLPAMKFKLFGSPTTFAFHMGRFHAGELANFGKCNALITYDLSSSDIDLEKVLALIPSSPKKGASGSGTAPASKAPPPDWRPMVSPGLQVSGKMAFKSFFYKKIKFANAVASTTLLKRQLKTTASVAAFSGSNTAAFTLDMNRFPHAYAYNLAMTGVSAKSAVNDTVDSFATKDPGNYKDKIEGIMTLRHTGTGLLDAAPAQSLKGQGPVTVKGVKIQALAMLGGLSQALKNKDNAMTMDQLDGTVTIGGGKATLNLKSQGNTGRMRIQGSIGFDGNYAPDLRVENDVKKEYVDSGALLGSLPGSLKGADLSRAADAQGYVPVDFKLTGSVASNPGLKALDLTRLTKNVTNSYTKQVQQKAQEQIQQKVGDKLGNQLGDKLKGLFGK